jgi:hypothetical protein
MQTQVIIIDNEGYFRRQSRVYKVEPATAENLSQRAELSLTQHSFLPPLPHQNNKTGSQNCCIWDCYVLLATPSIIFKQARLFYYASLIPVALLYILV